MTTVRALIAVALAVLSASACAQVVDSFDSGIESWRPEMMHGKVDGCRTTADAGALRIDYDLGAEGTNHIIYARTVSLDMEDADGLSFDIKGRGGDIKIYLFIWDGIGRHVTYGPTASNKDFHSRHAEWHNCKVDFDKDGPVEGGGIDLSDVRRIGFMLNQDGPRKGSVWIDNLSVRQGQPRVRLSSKQISPNGDGFRDVLKISARAQSGTTLDIKFYNSAGTLVSTFVEGYPLSYHRTEFTWDGTRFSGRLPDGTYTMRAEFKGKQSAVQKESITVQTVPKWPAINYATKPFFPIGVWFEGNPNWGGYPSTPDGARRYYDRCFADLAAHGFNTVTVPNCPKSLWNTLLQSAQKHKIKVVLEIAPLAELVSAEPTTEAKVYSVAKAVHAQLGNYDSLLRYQIRDEPASSMIPNWLLVQRILAAVDPTRPAFSCFCSVPALAGVAGQTKLSEAVYDIYPQRAGMEPQSLGGFLGALDAFKDASMGYTQWPVLQSFAKPNVWRYPTPEELRAMTYLSLAAGAKGVFYFIYQTLPHHPEKLEGLVDARGRPTPIYEAASTLARELRKLAPTILGLTPASTLCKVEGDARLGSFTDKAGNSVLIVASVRPDAAVTAKVTPVPDAKWRDLITGEEIASKGGYLDVPLGPGCGRVLAMVTDG